MHKGMWKTGARRHWRSSRPQPGMTLTQALRNMIYTPLFQTQRTLQKCVLLSNLRSFQKSLLGALKFPVTLKKLFRLCLESFVIILSPKQRH